MRPRSPHILEDHTFRCRNMAYVDAVPSRQVLNIRPPVDETTIVVLGCIMHRVLGPLRWQLTVSIECHLVIANHDLSWELESLAKGGRNV